MKMKLVAFGNFRLLYKDLLEEQNKLYFQDLVNDFELIIQSAKNWSKILVSLCR